MLMSWVGRRDNLKSGDFIEQDLHLPIDFLIRRPMPDEMKELMVWNSLKAR